MYKFTILNRKRRSLERNEGWENQEVSCLLYLNHREEPDSALPDRPPEDATFRVCDLRTELHTEIHNDGARDQ